MEERFSWIPFYSELAKALLAYKDERKPLVDFVYSEFSLRAPIFGILPPR